MNNNWQENTHIYPEMVTAINNLHHDYAKATGASANIGYGGASNQAPTAPPATKKDEIIHTRWTPPQIETPQAKQGWWCFHFGVNCPAKKPMLLRKDD